MGSQLLSFSEYHGVYCRHDIELDYTLTVIAKDVVNFYIRCCYNGGHNDQNKVEHVAIRCINRGKQTDVSMDDMNTKYKDITTLFAFNTVLNHVFIPWIIETCKQLEYDTDKHNSD